MYKDERTLEVTVTSPQGGFNVQSLVNMLMQLLPLFILVAIIPVLLKLFRR